LRVELRVVMRGAEGRLLGVHVVRVGWTSPHKGRTQMRIVGLWWHVEQGSPRGEVWRLVKKWGARHIGRKQTLAGVMQKRNHSQGAMSYGVLCDCLKTYVSRVPVSKIARRESSYRSNTATLALGRERAVGI
jgi:hypothetical protein